MKVLSEISEIRRFFNQEEMHGKSIGFIPTMGALHEGHLSLVRQSIAENDITACSIFVNPAQFNNPDDLKKYPRDLNADLSLLEELKCDLVFHPSPEIMYPSQSITSFSFGYLEEIMEGKFRPGHFKGVALVVSKLLNILTPDKAYFGEKDLQQLTIIQTMSKELNIPVEIISVPTMRESDGLAMSSRNLRLNSQERISAADIYRALYKAKSELNDGKSVNTVKESVKDFFNDNSQIELEYFEVVRTSDLKEVSKLEAGEKVSLCIAGYLGKVRLIDNLSLI